MKLFAFLQLIHGILNKTIDEIQYKINGMEENDLPHEDHLDVSAFDLIIGTVTDMKRRYLEFKSEVEDEPTEAEAVRNLRLVLDEEPDDSGNNGGLH